MQEEVENRTLTLIVSGTKFTGRLFKAAISKYMAHRREKKLEKQRGRDSPVTPKGKQTVKQLADQLHDAVQHIHGTYQEAALPELGEGEDIDESLPADPNVKNYSYTVVDGAVYFRENSRMVRTDLNATAEARV